MPLWEFSNQNKHKNWRTRIIYVEEGKPLVVPNGFGNTFSSRFKYTHTHPILPPCLTKNRKGEVCIVPGWKVVHPKTTLNDIVWEKPKIQIHERKVEKFESISSTDPSLKYITKRFTEGNKVSYSCNCPGVWRSKERKCKHIKLLENG